MTSEVSQKCRYALRALFELARRYGEGPLTVGRIAEAQAIPQRFLETILSQLRQGEFVVSRRGVDGGYMLARRPEDLTAGEVIRFVDGPVGPVGCLAEGGEGDCPLRGRCAFMDMWRQARDAVADVYDSTTLRNLLEAGAAAGVALPNYCI